MDWWNKNGVMMRMQVGWFGIGKNGKSSFAFDRLGESALFRSLSYYFGNMHKCIIITIK